MQEYKMPYREQNSNKGTFGKVLNICGSKNYIGAAYLSTISALKVGAGFSALASEKNVIRSVSAMLPEAVYLTRDEGLKLIGEFSTVLIGCGLGLSWSSKHVFKSAIKKLKNTKTPVIIDADGLNILSKGIEIDIPNLILTPHPLEAARLLGLSLEEVLEDLSSSAKCISKKYNCVTVLKSHRTVICSKDEIFINQHGNSALAKAGSGDVLAGIISGLTAQGTPVFEAAKLGVYLHSITGEIASQELSEYSVLASDLPKYLHKAIKTLTNVTIN
jgi:NAD(P)H-hydrate epimerase